jgi:hypothetical protein
VLAGDPGRGAGDGAQVEWKLPSNTTATTTIPILTFSFLPDTSSDLIFPAMALNWCVWSVHVECARCGVGGAVWMGHWRGL